MVALLRNTQEQVKSNFAYHAMAGALPPCDLRQMRIRLREQRDRLGLSLEDMASRVGEDGVSVSQLSRWESGGNNIPSSRLPELAKAYRCRINDIFDDDDDDAFLKPGPSLYVKGIVQAGEFVEVWEVPEDEWERYTGRADVVAPVRERFGVRVVGESMNEVYVPGTILDCVALRGDETIPNGKRVIVQRLRFGGGIETTVKEYHVDADGIEWLVPKSNNPAFQAPFRCDEPGEDIEEIRICAVVVASLQPE